MTGYDQKQKATTNHGFSQNHSFGRNCNAVKLFLSTHNLLVSEKEETLNVLVHLVEFLSFNHAQNNLISSSETF